MNTVSVPFPFAHLVVSMNDDTVLSCHWSTNPVKNCNTPLAHIVIQQCQHYLSDGQYHFDLPLPTPRTAFEAAYRKLLDALPAGKVLIYSEAATRLNSHPRAVGQTSRRNPVLLFVPCHRIIGMKNLGGYAGSTGDDALQEKRWLLQHEGVTQDVLFA